MGDQGIGLQPRVEACRRFGEAIKALWLGANPDLPYREIAQAAGTGTTTVSDVMAGRRFPKKDLAQRIVRGFGGDFNELSDLWDDLNALQRGAARSSAQNTDSPSQAITRFRDNSEFYGAARESILAATDQIRVTYARQYPPNGVITPEAKKYFATMLDWAAQAEHRSVTRVFGVPVESPDARKRVTDYLVQHRAEVERRKLWNYEVCVFEYTARADLLNMALFDEDVAYIAISGHHPRNLSGIRVTDSEYTTLLVAHFEQLLAGCKSLTDYLNDLEGGR
jgi:hypothetical protein